MLSRLGNIASQSCVHPLICSQMQCIDIFFANTEAIHLSQASSLHSEAGIMRHTPVILSVKYRLVSEEEKRKDLVIKVIAGSLVCSAVLSLWNIRSLSKSQLFSTILPAHKVGLYDTLPESGIPRDHCRLGNRRFCSVPVKFLDQPIHLPKLHTQPSGSSKMLTSNSCRHSNFDWSQYASSWIDFHRSLPKATSNVSLRLGRPSSGGSSTRS